MKTSRKQDTMFSPVGLFGGVKAQACQEKDVGAPTGHLDSNLRQPLWRAIAQYLLISSVCTHFDPAILILQIFWNIYNKHALARLMTATLLIITENWKLVTSQTVFWYLMEYYVAHKKYEICM